MPRPVAVDGQSGCVGERVSFGAECDNLRKELQDALGFFDGERASLLAECDGLRKELQELRAELRAERLERAGALLAQDEQFELLRRLVEEKLQAPEFSGADHLRRTSESDGLPGRGQEVSPVVKEVDDDLNIGLEIPSESSKPVRFLVQVGRSPYVLCDMDVAAPCLGLCGASVPGSPPATGGPESCASSEAASQDSFALEATGGPNRVCSPPSVPSGELLGCTLVADSLPGATQGLDEVLEFMPLACHALDRSALPSNNVSGAEASVDPGAPPLALPRDAVLEVQTSSNAEAVAQSTPRFG